MLQATRLCTLLAAVFISAIQLRAATPCESLTSLALPDTRITLAQSIRAGGFAAEDPGQNPPAALPTLAFKDLPAFCRVAFSIKPSKDSNIRVEVWMPISGWSGKFMGVGNGGYAGTISYSLMSAALAHSYATASTDTGHEGTNADGRFFSNPDKLIDFGYRAVHEMTLKAKLIIAAYYGDAPKVSYWNGCSTGGRQALKEAQRFPADYDGIVAGAPSGPWTHLNVQSAWVSQVVHKDEANYIPPSKYAVVHKAVLQACDARDGVKDGIIENPARCDFDPKVLECKEADGPNCLTPAQVETARAMYRGPINPKTKQQVSPGLFPGSELGWDLLAGPQSRVPIDYLRYAVFKDPNWNYRMLNLERDVALADHIDNGVMNAADANLKPFFSHGGKLLQYHGGSDNLIPPLSSINYYKQVLEKSGGSAKVNDSYRLFVVPGMAHCRGGEGVNSFDSLSVLEEWVENKTAPDRIAASRIVDGKVERTRPLCPFPQVATYKGTGSTDDAANFSCSPIK